MQRGGETDSLITKDFGRIIYLQNAEINAKKSIKERPRFSSAFGAFYIVMHVGVYMGRSRRVVQWSTQSQAPGKMASGTPRMSINYANISTKALDLQYLHQAMLII